MAGLGIPNCTYHLYRAASAGFPEGTGLFDFHLLLAPCCTVLRTLNFVCDSDEIHQILNRSELFAACAKPIHNFLCGGGAVAKEVQ